MAQPEDGSTINDTSGIPGVDMTISGGASAPQSNQQQPQQLPAYLTNALQSLAAGGQMFPTVDQNSVMMTNAAAAIAAVAASAMNMNQGNTVGGAGGVGVSPVLLAALRNSGLVPPSNSAGGVTIPSHVASLLSAVSNGGGSLAGLSLPGSTGVLPPTIQGQLQQLFSQVDTNKLSTPPPSPPVSNTQTSSALSIGPSMSSAPIAGMQGWSLKQLEQHVALLQRLQQPVPQTVALLLAEAQRKEKKKTAKRAANRKSASTSRARKKALVEEITRANARLKRQAMILSLLPDLVIATTMEGEISFCSAQVERILGHNPDDLVGIKFDRILTPSSREILQKLFSRLVHPNKTISTRAPQGSRRGAKRRHEQKEGDKSSRKDGVDSKGTDAPGRESSSGDGDSGNSGTTSGAAIISEQSFPLAIVEVDSKQGPKTASAKNSRLTGNENSDNSTSNNSGSNNTSSGSKQQVSSLSNATGMSPTDSPDEDEGAGQADSNGSKRAKTCKKGKRTGKSDDSSLSSEAKKASDNLDRNVRRHNQRMLDGSQKSQSDHGPKDDVIGESVTANNASARLSSLKHIPSPAPKKNDENDQSSSDDSLLAGVEEGKKVENQSDDSGYRESNDSREEESSSGSDSSNAKKKRRKPLAPTARLCLVRADLTTLWCEVTSAMRQHSEEVDPLEMQLLGGSVDTDPPPKKEAPVQEFLLCLRPMRDGNKKADESMRLISRLSADEKSGIPNVSSSGNDSSNTSNDKIDSEKTSEDTDSKNKSTGSDDQETLKWPPKKRPLDSSRELLKEVTVTKVQKRAKTQSSGGGHPEDHLLEENTVIESLMLMNKH